MFQLYYSKIDMKRIFLSVILAVLFFTCQAATVITIERLYGNHTQVDLNRVQTIQFFKNNKIQLNLTTESSQSVEQVRSLIFGELTTSVEDFSTQASISVYPNPTVDALMVNGVQDKSDMVIYSMNGTMIHSQVAQDGINKIDVSALPHGMYLLHLNNETFKFTKE